MEEKIYSRNCPDCSKELKTKNKYYFKKVVTNNQKCGSCTLKGRTFSDEHKANLSKNHADLRGDKNPFYGKKHTDEVMAKMSKSVSKAYSDPKLRKRISDSKIEWHKTNDNPFKGKTHSEETKLRMIEMANERWENPEERAKMSASTLKWAETNENSFKGKKHTEETKLSMRGRVPYNKGKTGLHKHDSDSLKKMRVAAIERISIAKFNGGQVCPNYNISSIML